MKLPRDFSVGVLSSLTAALLLAVFAMLSRAVISGEVQVAGIRAALLCIYCVFVLGALYVFIARRLTLVHPQTKVLRFSRLARVVAAVGLAAGGAVLVWAFLPYTIPGFKVHVRNDGQYGVLLRDEGIFWIVIPESPASQAIADRGLCRLSWLPNPQQLDKPLLVPPKSTAEFRCDILDPKAYRSYYESQNMDVQLTLVDSNSASSSDTEHFSAHSVEQHWLTFELGR